MPPPKRRHTRSRRDMRRAQSWRIEAAAIGKCSNCGAAKQPHAVCKSCGFYNGQLVVPKKVKKSKQGESGGSAEGGQEQK